MKWVVLALACFACSDKKLAPFDAAKLYTADANNYGDDPAFDAFDVEIDGPIEAGPVTIDLPAAAGEPFASRAGVLVVAEIDRTWRYVDPSTVKLEGTKATIPENALITIPEIASRAEPAGVVLIVGAHVYFDRINDLAFALHRECWAFATVHEGKLVARFPKTCPPVELPDHDKPVFALDIDADRATFAFRKEKYGPVAFGAHEHAKLGEMLQRTRVEDGFTKMKTLAYAVRHLVDVETFVKVLATVHEVGFIEARWVPQEWLPMKFPYGGGADPPPPPPPPPAPPRVISVSIDKVTVKGRPTEEVDRVVRSRAGLFRACYQRDLNRTPAMKGGTIDLKLEIDLTGTTTATATRVKSLQDTTTTCITSNMARLRFPPQDKKSTVRVLLTFASP